MCDTKYRGPKDRSTQKSGPSGLDFWVRLAFGQAQNKNQGVSEANFELVLRTSEYRMMDFVHHALNQNK